MAYELLALDRASVRRMDEDGHLHIEVSPITRAGVNPYYGREIVDWQRLGLDPDRIYQVFRPPEELEKAAETFDGKPLLSIHRPQTADDHEHGVVVGAVSNVRWDPPYLKAEMSVWSRDGIDGIEDGSRRELSASYRYDPELETGEYNGEPYTIIMRRIRANHVSLVERGRAGPDVFVADAALTPPESVTHPSEPAAPADPGPPAAAVEDAAPSAPNPQEIPMATRATAALTRTALLASGALRAYLKPKLAADAALDVAPLVARVNKATWKAEKPKLAAAIKAAAAGKLAADEDIEDIQEVLDDLDDVVDELADTVDAVAEETAADPDGDSDRETAADEEGLDAGVVDRLLDFLADKLSPEDLEAVRAMLRAEADAGAAPVAAQDRRPADAGRAPRQTTTTGNAAAAVRLLARGSVTKTAMDAAIRVATARAARDAEAATIARLRAIATAEKEVRPFIGELAVAQDSAAATYRLALDHLGVDLADVPEAAYGAVLRALPKPGDKPEPAARPAARVAMDARSAQARAAMFPNADRLGAQ